MVFKSIVMAFSKSFFIKKAKITLGVLGLVFTANAYSTVADLVERDYLVAGDSLITYDNSTGLEWLDISYTVGNSMLDTEADASLLAAGWQWVTTDQMETMFDHARDDPDWSDPFSEPRVVYPMVSLLGATFTTLVPGEYETKQLFGLSRNFDSIVDGGETLYTYSLMRGGISLNDMDPFFPNLPFPLCDPLACVDFNGGFPSFLESTSSEYFGSWLVRNTAAVPAPPITGLLITGLIGLAVTRRKIRNS